VFPSVQNELASSEWRQRIDVVVDRQRPAIDLRWLRGRVR